MGGFGHGMAGFGHGVMCEPCDVCVVRADSKQQAHEGEQVADPWVQIEHRQLDKVARL